jgi:hypothetical protein
MQIEQIAQDKRKANNSIIGIGEIVLLPLDALKIKLQISSKAYEGKTAFGIIKEEGL